MARKLKPLELALIKCTDDVLITGRRDDGESDHCFIRGKTYWFIVGNRKQEEDFYTTDEVGERHFIGNETDVYFHKHFDLIERLSEDDVEDKVLVQRMRRISRENKYYTVPDDDFE